MRILRSFFFLAARDGMILVKTKRKKNQTHLMDVFIVLANQSFDEEEKIQLILLEIFYHFFRLENARAMCEPVKIKKDDYKKSNLTVCLFFLTFLFI